jgi:hypothetical protein
MIKEIQVAGNITVGDKEYWLIHPRPVPKDNWETDTMFRFLVVPKLDRFIPRDTRQTGGRVAYPRPRHIVVHNTPFTIEYLDSATIWIKEPEYA